MIMAVVLLIAGTALAGHGGHGGGQGGHDQNQHQALPDMHKQHRDMMAADKEWELCKKSLAAGDLKAAGAALERMETALIDLDKFKPLQNKDRFQEFQAEAGGFKANLAKLAEALTGKKSEEAQGLLDKIDGGCMMCHHKFR